MTDSNGIAGGADAYMRVARLCEERAESYGSLRQSTLTAITLDRAAQLLRLAAPAEVDARVEAMRAVYFAGFSAAYEGERETADVARDSWAEYLSAQPTGGQ